MASTLPSGALGSVADSIKSFVAPATEDTTTASTQETPAAAATTNTADTVTSQVDDKTVHKSRAPAVEHETVKSREHEKVDTVVDKEVHQDHYHRTVQPVKDKEVLPTEHTYKENQTEREFDHRDDTAAKKAQQEASQFQNERVVEDTKHTKEHLPTQQGEHVHHHIHETVQPVINKETIQPKVVHTTNHVHETHHLNAEHHGATVAPEVTLSEFEKGVPAKEGAEITKE